MSPHSRPAGRRDQPVHAGTHAIVDSDDRVLGRYRTRIAARRRARLIGSRNRRAIARWLRRTAAHTQPPHPLARRRETLLHYRVAAVRPDLLEIAAMLDHVHDPDPASMAALHDLLANGCDSPLYDADIHVSELRATLHYIRSALAAGETEIASIPDARQCGARVIAVPDVRARTADRDKTPDVEAEPSRSPCPLEPSMSQQSKTNGETS